MEVAARLTEQLQALDPIALETLAPGPRDALRLYYGLAGTPRATLAQTATRLDCSIWQVREALAEMAVEGSWVDRVVGLDGVRNEIAMLRTPDGHGRLELIKFHTPPAATAEPNAPVNTLGIGRIMFAVADIDGVLARLQTHGAVPSARGRSTRTSTGSATSAAPRASSSRCRAVQLKNMGSIATGQESSRRIVEAYSRSRTLAQPLALVFWDGTEKSPG